MSSTDSNRYIILINTLSQNPQYSSIKYELRKYAKVLQWIEYKTLEMNSCLIAAKNIEGIEEQDITLRMHTVLSCSEQLTELEEMEALAKKEIANLLNQVGVLND